MKRISKRIERVTITRMTDDSPDTSYLGDYSNRPESEYAIDRAHSLDCQAIEMNHFQTVDALERIIRYLDEQRTEEGNNPDSIYWEPLDAAIEILIDTQTDAQECDCSGGDMERNEYRYFNPCWENYKGEKPADIRQHCQRDYERMESLNRGDWCFIGVRAEAEIIIDGVTQDISSGGLWSIESNSDRTYLAEIDGEQLSELREQLRALGLRTRAISAAFQNLEHAE
jgi:hypothetical protein